MQPPRSAFKLQELPNAVCLRIVRGAATPATLSEFGAAINEMIAKSDRARLIVDLTEVDFMPTAMLGHLIAASTKLRIKGGRIRLIGVNAHITGVFEVTRMKDHFDFHPTVDTALASFGGSDAA
jgi:anti-sigma B factor antagonist